MFKLYGAEKDGTLSPKQVSFTETDLLKVCQQVFVHYVQPYSTWNPVVAVWAAATLRPDVYAVLELHANDGAVRDTGWRLVWVS